MLMPKQNVSNKDGSPSSFVHLHAFKTHFFILLLSQNLQLFEHKQGFSLNPLSSFTSAPKSLDMLLHPSHNSPCSESITVI